tara:strand:- start:14528 stop:14938 length:411 start_codon:yes stop_codon:yes gene_type:complete
LIDNKDFFNIPRNFKEEKKALISIGIDSLFKLQGIRDSDILKIVNIRDSLATAKNLKRLRCIATLMLELEIPQEEAALLMHSGVASIKALASLTPQELLNRAGRLERLLNSQRTSPINLQKANVLITKAKNRQKNN